MSEDGWHWCRRHGGQRVLQRGENSLLQVRETEGVPEVVVVGTLREVQHEECGRFEGKRALHLLNIRPSKLPQRLPRS